MSSHLDNEYLDVLIAHLETGGPIVLDNPGRDALPLMRELRHLRSLACTAEEREALRNLTSYTSTDLPSDALVAYTAIARLIGEPRGEK